MFGRRVTEANVAAHMLGQRDERARTLALLNTARKRHLETGNVDTARTIGNLIDVISRRD